jgi:uncharacterized 2Fe-2S/4Fe-4S cluster protein (DUF4445 family)
VIGGNTTMLQIASRIDPVALGSLPFTVGIKDGTIFPADHFRFNVNPQARIHIPPITHAFIGSDISAGLLSVDFFDQNLPALFLVIGSNAELVLAANNQIVATSAAAGPVFEGMGICCGMQARDGAIEKIWVDNQDLQIQTIGKTAPLGICGSGVIDVTACLLQLGAIETSGRLLSPDRPDHSRNSLFRRYTTVNGIAAIKLDGPVFFTQKDIRQVQLAKSAIQTGIDMLLDAAEIQPESLNTIIIGGGFGYYLNESSLRKLEIIPAGFSGEIRFAGNTCITGCVNLLLDKTARRYLQKQKEKIKHIAIAESSEFQSRFISNMTFKEALNTNWSIS